MSRKWWWVGGGVAVALLAVGSGMNQGLIDMLKKHEGLRLRVYTDIAGHKTIGYGHKLLPGENFTVITKEQADALLRADVARIWAEIAPAIKRTPTENEKAAMIGLAFNVGANAFKKSTLLKKFNEGDKAGAVEEFARWAKARVDGVLQVVPGLAKRRADEARLFVA